MHANAMGAGADVLLERTDWELYGMCCWRSPLDNGEREFMNYA
jgi:hypothetical protein